MLSDENILPFRPTGYIFRELDDDIFRTRLLGVILAIVTVYIIGVFVGNLIGRTAWRLAEVGVMKVPLIRAIYPAVKQVTDFLLSERTDQFPAKQSGRRRTACKRNLVDRFGYRLGGAAAFGCDRAGDDHGFYSEQSDGVQRICAGGAQIVGDRIAVEG